MIDTKEPHHSTRFYNEMERILRENGLLDSAFFIGTADAGAYFKGKARISVDDRAELQRLADSGEDVASRYFLFEHGDTLDAKGIELGKRLGVPAVVSINEYHYLGRDHIKAAHADIARLRSLGLSYFPDRLHLRSMAEIKGAG